MPHIVPVGDFRADVTSVSRHTDENEAMMLTQNGHPRWAMVDYAEWSAAAAAQEKPYARALLEAERMEADGTVSYIDADAFEKLHEERLVTLLGNAGA